MQPRVGSPCPTRDTRRPEGFLRRTALALLLPLTLARPADLRAQADLPRLQAVARFGCVECAGPHLLVSVQDIAVSSAGRIFVLDIEAPMVRVFDASGTVQLAFGRRGRGPREFQLPAHVGVHPDGRFHVLDARLQRLTRFDPGGQELQTVPLPAFPLAAAYAPANDVLFIATTDFRAPTAEVLALAGGAAEPRRILRMGPEFPRQRDGAPTLFFDLIATAGGGIALGAGTFEYRIRRYDAAGQPAGDVARDIPRVKRTPREVELERERRERSRERVARMRAAEGGGRGGPGADPPIPEEKNHFNVHALAHDAAGRLWVRTERGGPAETVFDLFTPAGGYIGELRLPFRIERFAIGAGLLAAVVTGEDETVQIAVWRLTG